MARGSLGRPEDGNSLSRMLRSFYCLPPIRLSGDGDANSVCRRMVKRAEFGRLPCASYRQIMYLAGSRYNVQYPSAGSVLRCMVSFSG